jgi:hypothetical protein
MRALPEQSNPDRHDLHSNFFNNLTPEQEARR